MARGRTQTDRQPDSQVALQRGDTARSTHRVRHQQRPWRARPQVVDVLGSETALKEESSGLGEEADLLPTYRRRRALRVAYIMAAAATMTPFSPRRQFICADCPAQWKKGKRRHTPRGYSKGLKWRTRAVTLPDRRADRQTVRAFAWETAASQALQDHSIKRTASIGTIGAISARALLEPASCSESASRAAN